MAHATRDLAAAIAGAILAAGLLASASAGAAGDSDCQLSLTGTDGEAVDLALSDLEVGFSRRLTVIRPTLGESAGDRLYGFLEPRVGETVSIAFAGVEIYDAWPVHQPYRNVGGLYLRPELWQEMRGNLAACPDALAPDLPKRPNDDG